MTAALDLVGRSRFKSTSKNMIRKVINYFEQKDHMKMRGDVVVALLNQQILVTNTPLVEK